MAASIETVREKMDVKPTPEDKGLICTIRVTAYDKGVIEVDGRPVSTIDSAHSWLSANEVIGMVLAEFYRQVAARHSKP
jgi:hypothetical protein